MKRTTLMLLTAFMLLGLQGTHAQCDTIKEISVTIHSYTKKNNATLLFVSTDFAQNTGRQNFATIDGAGKDKDYGIVDMEKLTLKQIADSICYSDFESNSPFLEFKISKADTGWTFKYTVTIKTKGGKTYIGESSDKVGFTKTELTVRKPLPKLKEVKKEITKSPDKKKDELSRFMYLNAVDFDFNNSKSGYVGHLNMYRKPYTKFGFNAGFMKINYNNNNDSTIVDSQNNIKMNPLNTANADTTYIRQYNQLTRKVKSTSFSIYFQALYNLRSKDKQYNIYAHAHFELLISRFTVSTTLKTISQDTITVPIADIPILRTTGMSNKFTTTRELLNGYFGGGLTFDLGLTENSSLFFQPTIGFTTNYPEVSSINSQNFSYIDNNRNWNGFYLIRSYYRNKLEKSEIIVGTDIRGLLPRYQPYYSVYIGVNIDVNALAGILK